MVLLPRWQRPGVPRSLGNHEGRIKALERLLRGAGWRFNTDNEGGFGYVRFNDSFDLDTFPNPPSPIAPGGDWGGVIEDDSGDGLLLGSTTIVLVLGQEDVVIEGDQTVTINSGGPITISLVTGQALTVVDNSNNPIFRVDEDGDLHGKTGKALTFDL